VFMGSLRMISRFGCDSSQNKFPPGMILSVLLHTFCAMFRWIEDTAPSSEFTPIRRHADTPIRRYADTLLQGRRSHTTVGPEFRPPAEGGKCFLLRG
jgi:hypothetical protein